MHGCPDRTTTRGYDAAFHTTHWTEIFHARSPDEPQRREALEHLLRSYWKPVYCYLRCKGNDRDTAKDLTQGFFSEIVLGRDLFRQADRAKGKFRSFLLSCLNRYAANIRRAQRTKQRMAEGGLVRLEDVDWLRVPDSMQCGAPDEIFDYAWASALLDQALAEAAARCRDRGNAAHWDLFRARVLLPTTQNTPRPSLTELCEKHGIRDEAKASHMIFTVKRCFRSVLRRHLRQLVNSDAEVDDEIRHFMKILSRGSARF